MCGIVGIVSSNDVNQQIYDSLLLLQHRGQDSTGIATMENTVFHIHKVKGQVNTAYRTRDMRNLICLLYTSPSPRDREKSRMPSSA